MSTTPDDDADRFAALRAAKGGEQELMKFWDMPEPVCPHCGRANHPGDHPSFYEEGDHEHDCDYCGESFKLITRIALSFHTDEQDGL